MTRRRLIDNELGRIDGCFPGSQFPKHQKMCTSPFVFYRGSSQLFYADLASGHLSLPSVQNIPLTTIMGDCHTSNFGFFTEEGSHAERIVFSINDFDDACIGHGVWDLIRLLVSLPLVADHCDGVVKGIYSSEKDYSNKLVVNEQNVLNAMETLLDSYLLVLQQGLARKSNEENFLDLTFEDFATPSPLQKRYQKAARLILGGDKFLQKSALAKAVDLTQFPLTFRDRPTKFKGLTKDKETSLRHALAPYFFQDILDIVARVGSGTGSVNMDRYYALIGPKNIHHMSQIGLCHVVEVKQQRVAAPIYYFPDIHHQNQLNPAHLTVKCQRRIQRRTDYVLDEAFFDQEHWLVRSRHHAKVGIDPEHIGIGEVNRHQGGLAFYASACAQELARAHCRGDRFSLDYEKSMAKYIEDHKVALLDSAQSYAQQVIKDWQYLCEREGCS
ncbi:DUF2252 family protein [Glaciecola sp. 1036]|uniref:DUF2252 family protein n=1 Tax=Alteromonadaceae TaxID=72275 RepID=UPI003D08342F